MLSSLLLCGYGCGFIQGSAADIIKIAMINIYAAISEDVDTVASSSSTETRFHLLKGRCRILLQVGVVHLFLFLSICSVLDFLVHVKFHIV